MSRARQPWHDARQPWHDARQPWHDEDWLARRQRLLTWIAAVVVLGALAFALAFGGWRA